MTSTTRKLALVTGGAKGIGLSITERLAADGWDLVLWGRDMDALSTVAARIEKSRGVKVSVQAVDLGSRGSVEPAFQAMVTKHGLPLALVCNAGDYGTLGRMGELDIDAWKKSFELNFFSVAEMVHCYIREATRKPTTSRRKIVLMSGSGLGGSKVWPGISAYGCSKAAISRLVEIVHEEVQTMGIDINCIAPGGVTGLTQQALQLPPEVLGPLHHETNKISSSGGDSPELAAIAIAKLLSAHCDGLSGRLISAKWDDKFIGSAEGAKRVNADRDLLRLRRIDDELFSRVPQK